MLKLDTKLLRWEMREPFKISRGTQTHAEALLVTLTDDAGRRGRGEAYGIPYEGETPQSIREQVEALREPIERGLSLSELQELLPYGGARCAVDLALWDLRAKAIGVPAWQSAGIEMPRNVTTAFTIGMRSLEATAAKARELADHPLLKIKVDATDPLAVIEAVHRAAPRSRLIVDPNQSWSIELLREISPQLAPLGVALLEQPLPVDGDAGLRGFERTVPICADELVHDLADLPKARDKYDLINIKLDKTGGLTEALRLAQAARSQGHRLMVGCMAGSSLAMAPAAIVAQICEFVDLDGPLLQKQDWPHAITYVRGTMSFPSPELWG